MNRPSYAQSLAAALVLSAVTSTATAETFRYELQGVTDSSPTPVALVGGFTFDTVSSTFSDISVRFASNPVFFATSGVFNNNPALYHYVTDQFVAEDGMGNTAVLNYGSNFSNPGTYALTQTGANSISYVFLQNGLVQYDVVNGNIAAVPEPSTWAALLAGLLAVGLRARRRGCEAEPAAMTGGNWSTWPASRG